MPQSHPLKLTDFIREIPDFPKPGILFYDITPLLADPAAFHQTIRCLAEPFQGKKVDVVAAAEARGFIFAAPLALQLNASLVPIRKPGKLPYSTLSYSYELEYGTDTLQIHSDAVPAGSNVLVVDDLLATGGTVDACCKLVESAGGKVVGCTFVIELTGLGGREKISRYEPVSLIQY
jgi:adenine phosphoribosyltransferase